MDQTWNSAVQDGYDRTAFSARILGPVQVSYLGESIGIAVGRQRVVLAALLLDANEVVTVAELLERTWGECDPQHPRAALHTVVARLRQAFEGQGAGLSGVIHTSAAGYWIDVDPENFDLARFRRLVRRADDVAARGDLAAEAVLLDEALSHWRGPVLSDVQPDALDWSAVARLNEELLSAQERLHDVMLALGRHDDRLISELRRLAHTYPYRERIWRQLIQALRQDDRRAEALRTFSDLRAYLRAELGVDPSREVRDLHLSILRD